MHQFLHFFIGITYSADCLAYCIMTHLLWPARSEQYFLLANPIDPGDELDEFNEAPHIINHYSSSQPLEFNKITAWSTKHLKCALADMYYHLIISQMARAGLAHIRNASLLHIWTRNQSEKIHFVFTVVVQRYFEIACDEIVVLHMLSVLEQISGGVV